MDRLAILKGHFLNLVQYEETSQALLMTLNRPKVLNTLSTEVLEKIHSVLNRVGRRTLIIQGAGKVFCAGGDVVALVAHYVICPVFLQTEYSVVDRIHQSECFSVAIMKGLTMGGGAGLAGACKARVAMQSTVWAFPEVAIGVTPDVGGSYILPRLTSKAVGLYLALTGERVNSVDCFYLGVATHYVNETRLPELIQALQSSTNPAQVLEQFHTAPDRALCNVLKEQSLIEELFTNVPTIEELFSRLSRHSSAWAQKTLATLRFMCPLSLKVELRNFEMGAKMTHREALTIEYNSIIQMIFVDNTNFAHGVRTRLVTKKKDARPAWVPASVEEVTDEMVNRCIANANGPHYRPREYY